MSRRILEYSKALQPRFEVVILSLKPPDLPHIEKHEGAVLLRVPVGTGDLPSRLTTFDRALRRQIDSEDYGAVHFFDPFSGVALCESQSRFGYSIIYEALTFPSMELPSTSASDSDFKTHTQNQEVFCLMNSDAVICGSKVTREYILSLGVPTHALHVLRHPVDASQAIFPKLHQGPLELRFSGSCAPHQGLGTLISAMAIAAKKVDLRLKVSTPPSDTLRSSLENRVQQLKLSPFVEFSSHHAASSQLEWLAAGDLGVTPLDASERNRRQGSPLPKIAEFCLAGLGIVASDLPLTRELVPASARQLFPAGDVEALAKILVDLADNRPEVERMRRSAHVAASDFDAPTVCTQLLEIYDGLRIDQTRRGPSTPDEITDVGIRRIRVLEPWEQRPVETTTAAMPPSPPIQPKPSTENPPLEARVTAPETNQPPASAPRPSFPDVAWSPPIQASTPLAPPLPAPQPSIKVTESLVVAVVPTPSAQPPPPRPSARKPAQWSVTAENLDPWLAKLLFGDSPAGK